MGAILTPLVFLFGEALPKETFRRVKRQLRGDAFATMEKVIAERADPARERWITPETAAAIARSLGS